MARNSILLTFAFVLATTGCVVGEVGEDDSASTSLAGGGGVSPAKLGDAGWLCFVPAGFHEVHCLPPGAFNGDETLEVMVFDTLDPAAKHAHLLGTELLTRADLWAGQECPTDEWLEIDLDGNGTLDYYACHRFSGDHDE